MTFTELVIAISILVIIIIIGVPMYCNYKEKIQNAQVVSTLTCLELSIDKYYAENGKYPSSLADIGRGSLKDPWGAPFRYMTLPKDKKACNEMGRRKNEFKVINKDYDLYSLGRDGKTHQSLNNKKSWDDIIRGFNGSYVGVAKDII